MTWPKKIKLWQLSDGRTTPNKALAKKEQKELNDYLKKYKYLKETKHEEK